MKKVKGILLVGLIMCFASAGTLNAVADLTGPDIRWFGPFENKCYKISASNPHLDVRIDVEDESGIKQGIVWMKKGHHTVISDLGTWTRIWGRTFATGTSGPLAFSYTFSIRMLGRGEGEFTLFTEYQDTAWPSTSHSFVHFFTDTSSPTVRITSPADNSIICKDKNLRIKISASDSGCGIKNVSLFFDNRIAKGSLIGRDTSYPYEFTVPKTRFTAKEHKLYAIAYDKAGRSTRVSITIKPTRICLMMRVVK